MYGGDGLVTVSISIHAPLRERRPNWNYPASIQTYFNPRSITGATIRQTDKVTRCTISIHAPLRERQGTAC